MTAWCGTNGGKKHIRYRGIQPVCLQQPYCNCRKGEATTVLCRQKGLRRSKLTKTNEQIKALQTSPPFVCVEDGGKSSKLQRKLQPHSGGSSLFFPAARLNNEPPRRQRHRTLLLQDFVAWTSGRAHWAEASLLILMCPFGLLAVYKKKSLQTQKRFEGDASGECVVPGLEADQRILDATLVVLGHVLMHVWVVLPDVALGAAVRDRPEAEGRGIGVGTLELHSEAQKKSHRWILKTSC